MQQGMKISCYVFGFTPGMVNYAEHTCKHSECGCQRCLSDTKSTHFVNVVLEIKKKKSIHKKGRLFHKPSIKDLLGDLCQLWKTLISYTVVDVFYYVFFKFCSSIFAK